MIGTTVQDTDRQRAYALCRLDRSHNFELLALAGPGAILTDASGNSARLWEGEFACTLGS
jgi:hypothetical protein